MSALTLCICMGVSQAVNAQETTPRNILFIAVDDLRNWVNTSGDYTGPVQTWATDAGDYQGRTYTPNIDALAAVSTRYLNAYAAVPQCVGSRASVMMGLSPATHGITHASFNLDSEFFTLYNDETLKSLPEVMSDNGYYTASSGKLFSAPFPSRWNEAGPYPRFNFSPFDPGPDNTFFVPRSSLTLRSTRIKQLPIGQQVLLPPMINLYPFSWPPALIYLIFPGRLPSGHMICIRLKK